MGSIYSGVGLVSGLDYETLIDKLMTIEARPRDQVQARITEVDQRKTAYLTLSARITAALSRIQVLGRATTFRATTATASNSDLTVTTAGNAQPGSYRFSVRALAATHQLVTRGFESSSATLAPGTVTLESAQARTDADTLLDELNGRTGVQRGTFKIADASGREASINIADALTVDDVIDRINAADVGVTASVEDDQLVLTDTSGGSGTLRVTDVSGGRTAASLGFSLATGQDTDHDGVLRGTRLMRLASGTALTALNDGLGLRRNVAGNDFTINVGGHALSIDLSDIIKSETRLDRLNHGAGVRLGRVRITGRDGVMSEVDLSSAKTVADVKQGLESAFGGGRITVVLNGSKLLVQDSTSGTSALTIEDLSGHAAQDLGIAGSSDGSQITGRAIMQTQSVADVLAAINSGAGNEDDSHNPLVTARLSDDGLGFVLESQVAGDMVIGVPASGTSRALADLGLAAGTYTDTGDGASAAGQRVVGGVNTVLLKTINGGAGVTTGTVQIAVGGSSTDVDLSGATTLAEAVRRMQQAADDHGLNVSIGFDGTGTRLVVTSGDGVTPVNLTDVTGNFAATAGLTTAGASIRGANLQRQYVNEATRLADLNQGRGVATGRFRITGTNGRVETINTSGATTLQDIISNINDLNMGVTASINATGDGLQLVDTAGGGGTLAVAEEGSTTARDLNLLHTAESNRIDGSFEFHLDIAAGETLTSLASRFRSETSLAEGTLFDDGTGVTPYRLSITSRSSGRRGELLIDSTDADLGLATLTSPQDARILYGGNVDSGILLTSSTNTFQNTLGGVTLTANSVSTEPVSVTISRNVSSVVSALNGLVTDYNAALANIKEVGKYDQETEEAGVLLGESTLRTVEDRLFRAMTRAFTGTGTSITRLSDIGLKFSDSELSFDETKFTAAFEADPEAVITFFTTADTGAAAVLKEQIDNITGTDGLIPKQTKTLDSEKELLQDRVDSLNAKLARKRESLLKQYQTLETTLSKLQTQQSALSSLSSVVNNYISSLSTS